MKKALETKYNGCWHRSRLEARWAVFFKTCGIDYVYEKQGYETSPRIWYLPDFYLKDVYGMEELWIEVKGVMDDEDAEKIKTFAGIGKPEKEKNPILVLGEIPNGGKFSEVLHNIDCRGHMYKEDEWPNEFNFLTVNGSDCTAIPGVNKDGKFQLFNSMRDFAENANIRKTKLAYDAARQERFKNNE